ncbi:MAG: ArsR family transcriptional regulator [Deltaproteobacteria bacterium]|nr:ArsR family transcriptional regulator [Deltaproteobacteria bacterium]
MNKLAPKEYGGEFLLYQAEDGRTRIQVQMHGETVWLTINQMAELFQVNKSGISRHLKNMYESGELVQAATVAKFATVKTNPSITNSRAC